MTFPLRLIIIEDATDEAWLVVRQLGRAEARAPRQQTTAPREVGKFADTGIGLSTAQREVRRHERQPRAEAAIATDATFHFAWDPYTGKPIGRNDAVIQSYSGARL